MKRLIQYSEENPFLHALISRGFSILLLLALTLGVFSQSALARNTYVITDGDKVVVHTSFATDPTDVLQELGMSLGESDTVTTKPEEDGVSEIVVSRSNAVTLDDRGQIHAISTTAETVGELLEQYDIDLTEALVLSTSPDSKIYNGMKTRGFQSDIWRRNRRRGHCPITKSPVMFPGWRLEKPFRRPPVRRGCSVPSMMSPMRMARPSAKPSVKPLCSPSPWIKSPMSAPVPPLPVPTVPSCRH